MSCRCWGFSALPPPRQQKEARICFLLLWRKERMRLAGDIPLCNYSKLVLWADPATVPAWERRASLFKERQWFSLVVYFIRSINSVYMSVPTSQFLPSSPSPLVSIGCSLCLCLYFCFVNKISRGFPGGLDSKESACNGRDLGSIPGMERSPGEGNSYPLQYSGVENSMDRGVWQAPVHGVANSQT